MTGGLRHLVFALAIASVAQGSGAAAQGYSLDMLTAAQRAELEKRIDDYAHATSLLDACGKRPDTVRRALAAAQGCVAPASLEAIRALFTARLAEISHDAKWRCSGDETAAFLIRMQRAVDLTIQDIRAVCRK